MLISRSRNSHMRSPRSVTIAAMGIPFRTLNAAFGAHELHVRRVQRGLALDDPALDVLARIRPRMALDHVHAFDDEPVLLGQHLQDAAALAAVLARGDEHVVVLSNRSR